jgi:two-component system LytT family response regulator
MHDPDISIVAECGSGDDALQAIRKERPDLVFLDIEMPEIDGFDVLEMLGQQPLLVVFVTAYDRYAIKAFDAGALDYLLKPFEDKRFERMMERVKLRVERDDPAQFADSLAVKHAGSIVFVRLDEVELIEAADYYSRLHVGPVTHLLRRSLTELESGLNPAMFCRVDRISGLEINASGEHDVVTTNGARLPISRRYRRALRDQLGSRFERRQSIDLQ